MPEAHEAEELLIARAQQGDASAFGQLVRRHQDAIFNGILQMVGRREDAEDLSQEVFLKAFRSIGSFEGRSTLYTWLYAIALNVVISHRRKVSSRRRREALSLDARGQEERPVEVVDRSDPPPVVSEQHELGEQIRQAIAQLDDDHRTIVVLRDIEGFDYETISTLLGCAHGTVKSRLHRARLALREQLKDLLA